MTVSDRATLMDVGLGGPSVEACAWPRGTVFTFHDEPGEHDPCYVVMPDGASLPVNHHAGPGVDIARAKYIITACNAALRAAPRAEWVLVPREPTEEMVRAVWHHWLNGTGHSEECMANALRAMLGAAPASPRSGQSHRLDDPK